MSSTLLPRPAEAPDGEQPPATAPPRPPRREHSLAVHLVAYALLLLALAPLARLGLTTPDEGAYGLQAELVAEGRWALPPNLPEIDPEGLYQPIANATVADGRTYPYVKHPLTPFVTGQLVGVLGTDAGLAVLPLLSALAAAAAAWMLAAEIDARASRWAFWLTATSPLAFHAWIGWAHAPSIALSGLALVAAMRILRHGPSPLRLLGCGSALAAGALVRSEGVLFALAVLVVLGVGTLRRRGLLRSLPAVGVPGAIVAAALLAERAWLASILGGAAPTDLASRAGSGGEGFVAGRINGLWHSTLSGWNGGYEPMGFLLPAAVLVAAVWVRRNRSAPASVPEVALVGLAALYLLRAALVGGLVHGMVAAAPLLVIGLALAAGGGRWNRSLPLLGTVVLFTGAVWLTQYPDGGAFNWGGRFLSPILVPLAVVAGTGMHAVARRRPEGVRPPFTVAVGALAGTLLVTTTLALGDVRAGSQEMYDAVAAHASPVNVTTTENLWTENLPRNMWRERLAWLVAEPGQLPDALDRVASAGERQVTLVAGEGIEPSAWAGWSVEDRGLVPGTPLHVLVLTR